MQPYNDDDIIKGLIKEENWAFEYLYSNYYSMIRNYLINNNGSEEDAKDHFQDVIIALIKSVSKPSFVLTNNTKLGTYLYAVSNKIWLMKLKSKKSKPVTSLEEVYRFNLEEDQSTIAEKIVLEEKHKQIASAFDKLGTECKKLLDFYYFKRLRMRKIAEMMDYTEGFIRVKKNRCMSEFKKRVQQLRFNIDQ